MRNPEKHELMVGVKKCRKSYAVNNGSNIGYEGAKELEIEN